MEPPSDFANVLVAAVAGYDGPRARVICRMPDLYRFYTVLYADAALPKEARQTVSRVLAYFVVQDDVIPDDELGPIGFIDDVFVAAHAYRQLCRSCDADTLYRAWPADDDIDELMANAYRESRAEVSKKVRNILELAGFR